MPAPLRFYDRLAGKVAIVTGAGAEGSGVGTGKAMSLLFAREGASVCLVDREIGKSGRKPGVRSRQLAGIHSSASATFHVQRIASASSLRRSNATAICTYS